MDQDRTEKIRKLLAKAEAQGATEEERMLYQAKASELMIKWGIEEAMLVGEARPDEKIVYVQHVSSLLKTYWSEGISIGCRVANAMGSQGLIWSAGTSKKLGVVGYEGDIERILILWRSLELQATHALAAAIKKEAAWSWMSGTMKYNFRRSFLVGFGQAVGERLEALYKKTVEESGAGTDVVLFDRTTQVANWTEQNLHVTPSRRKRYYAGGWGQGADAGAKASIGQGAVAGEGQRAIGA
jgi:hypothetical protein